MLYEVITVLASALDGSDGVIFTGSAAGGRAGSAVGSAGDLNDDGYDDLAIGVPYEDVGAIVDAGGVNVVYGSEMGRNNFV